MIGMIGTISKERTFCLCVVVTVTSVTYVMFSSSGLFDNVPCPDKDRCRRVRCLFSHSPNARQPVLPVIPVSAPSPGPSRASNAVDRSSRPEERPSPSRPSSRTQTIPSKRPAYSGIKSYVQSSSTSSAEPPRKTAKVETPAKTGTSGRVSKCNSFMSCS